MENLYTGRLCLRKLTKADLPRLVEITNGDAIQYWLPDWQGSAEWIGDWFAGKVQTQYERDDPLDDGICWGIVEKSRQKLIGQIGLGRFDALEDVKVGIFYFIDDAYSGQGYASEAVQAVTEHGLCHYGYPEIIATVQPDHGASQRVLAKCGYEKQFLFEMQDNGQDHPLPFYYYLYKESKGQMKIRIETERLILREFTPSDLSALVKITEGQHIQHWLSDWGNCAEWVEGWYKVVHENYQTGDPRKKFILLAIESKADHKLIGQINTGCEEHPKELPGELSVGYFISESALNRGYATEAVKALTRYYFELGIADFFHALVKPDNAASAHVVQKAGFVFEKRLYITENDIAPAALFNYYRLYQTPGQ